MSSRAYDYMAEQARQRPDSTAAIGLQAIREAQYQRDHNRSMAIKAFFTRPFKKK